MVVRTVSVISSVLSREGALVSAQIAIESQFPLEDQSASLAWHSAQWFDHRTFGRWGDVEFLVVPGSAEARVVSVLTSRERAPEPCRR
jgi:hypothetical protein